MKQFEFCQISNIQMKFFPKLGRGWEVFIVNQKDLPGSLFTFPDSSDLV
jgi:hypothetical protein